ncbi:MAG: YeeE/YedE thiosulfate transporter family protein [Dehalococcoidia bacterium]|nr:YeeE/YedE thiosulfate transporter family protein [Dehalococcoidia bacterium]
MAEKDVTTLMPLKGSASPMQRTVLKERAARRKSLARISPVTFGVVLGVLAMSLEAYFTVSPPSAYGVCIACHGRDAINFVVNRFAGTSLPVSEASVVFPLLTVVGVTAGAALGAIGHGEFRWRFPAHSASNFVWGFLVMNFALLAAGCSIRLLLRAAHGDPLGLLSFLAMAAGIGVATSLMRWWALR